MRFSDVNNMAASICGMKPAATVQPNNQTVIERGSMYPYQFTTANDLVLDCWLDYSAAERSSNDSPGCKEEIQLCYALVNGVDIFDELSDDLAGLIEEEALASMEMDKWDDDYGRGEARAHERAECEA